MEKLCEETYFSQENELKYSGSTQIKSFLECPAKTLAKLKGEWEEPKSQAFLVGGYIDAAISGTLDVYKAKHPEMFKKDGTLKSEYIKAEYVLERIQRDKLFWKYVSGDHQTIMTASYNLETNEWSKEKEGNNIISIKIKIDSYFPEKAIVDFKYVKDFNPIWNEKEKEKQNFIDYWKYTWQSALYQKVVEVNTGKKLPCFIAAATKEEEPDIAVMNIDQDTLDRSLSEIENLLPHIYNYKNGIENPPRCEKCNYCKFTKELTSIIDYREINFD